MCELIAIHFTHYRLYKIIIEHNVNASLVLLKYSRKPFFLIWTVLNFFESQFNKFFGNVANK